MDEIDLDQPLQAVVDCVWGGRKTFVITYPYNQESSESITFTPIPPTWDEEYIPDPGTVVQLTKLTRGVKGLRAGRAERIGFIKNYVPRYESKKSYPPKKNKQNPVRSRFHNHRSELLSIAYGQQFS